MIPEVKTELGEGRRASGNPPPLLRRGSRAANQDEGAEGPSRRSSLSINFALPPEGSRRPSLRPGGRPTVGSMGRRLSIARKFSKPQIRPEPMEEKIELPAVPRFISLLSPEAQYAAMKCYEDLLFERILEASPEYSSAFERTPSPPQNLHMLCIKDKPENDGSSDKEDDGYASDTDSEKSKPVYIPLNSLPKRSHTEIKPRLPPLSREKKLIMTYRFQCAFDILDALKLKDGHLVTSPRVQSAYFDPVRSFATWHHNWSKEFKIVSKRAPASAKV